MTNKKIFFIGVLMVAFFVGNAQNTDVLKGLTKASFKDLNPGKPLMLDGISTPVYSENLTLLQGEDFMKTMSTGDYLPVPYIDNNKEVKAFVLRRATEIEKSKMIQMTQDRQENNDLLGKAAFPFTVTDISGKSYSLESLKGKTIVINFWFVECKPCVMEMPELNQLVEKYKNKEVVFLGFAINDKAAIEKFLKTKTFNYNIIPNSEEVIGQYKVQSFPTHLVIDKNSMVAYSTSGLGPNTMADLDKMIETLSQ